MLTLDWINIAGIAANQTSIAVSVVSVYMFMGFFAASIVLLAAVGRFGLNRSALALALIFATTLFLLGRMPAFSEAGAWANSQWFLGTILCAGGCLAFALALCHGFILHHGPAKDSSPRAIPWGFSVGFGLFALYFLLIFTSGPSIDLGLAIRHHTSWKKAILPLLFANDAVSGALVGLAFTWLTPVRKVAALLTLSELIRGFVISHFMLGVPNSWISHQPMVILSSPLGLLAGGFLALSLVKRRRRMEMAGGENQVLT